MQADKANLTVSDPIRAQALVLYETHPCALNEIALILGLSRESFRKARRQWAWPRRPSKTQRRKLADQCPFQPQPLHDKIEAQLRRELDAVEAMLAQDPAAVLPATAAEKRARTIASLVRALTELRRLGKTTVPTFDEAVDDEFPASLEDLRAELARRIDRLRDARRSGDFDEEA